QDCVAAAVGEPSVSGVQGPGLDDDERGVLDVHPVLGAGRPGAVVVGAGVAGDQPDDDGDLGAVDAQARIPGAACAVVAAVAAGVQVVDLDRPGADGVDEDARAVVAVRRAVADQHPARAGAGRPVPGDVDPVLPVPLGAAADHLAVRGV